MTELHDTAPAIIGDHPHRADPWWDRCQHPVDEDGTLCGLGAAAHTQTETGADFTGLTYRCPDCVTKRIDPCTHQKEGSTDG